MSGISVLVSKQVPCRICGKTDWCRLNTYPEGDIVHLCHRIHEESVVGTDGLLYRAIKTTDGGFTKYETVEQWEASKKKWLAEHGRKGGSTRGHRPEAAPAASFYQAEEVPVTGVSELASPERLDEVYRYFLTNLLLEKKHQKKLRKEWDVVLQGVNVYEDILGSFPIVSIPPEDRLRFSSKEPFDNLWRKKLMEQMVEDIGEPEGVPYFYRKKNGQWTFDWLSGICFPTFNSSGLITRLRVNDDYPFVDGEFEGNPGQFRYQIGESDTAGWDFIPESDGSLNYDDAVRVWEYGSTQNRITLSDKGYPPGKVRGKYKNCSSFRTRDIREGSRLVRRENILDRGCQSGSPISLYTRPGDDPCIVYVTEGEKKALVLNERLKAPAVSLPGVSSYMKLFEKEEGSDTSMMEALRDRGMSLAVLIYDSDKDEKDEVKDAEKKAVRQFIKNGFPIAIGGFNRNWSKGVDDLLLMGVSFQITTIR